MWCAPGIISRTLPILEHVWPSATNEHISRPSLPPKSVIGARSSFVTIHSYDFVDNGELPLLCQGAGNREK